MTHEFDWPTDEEFRAMREREERRVPQGCLRVWDSNSGLMGNYVFINDTRTNRDAHKDAKRPGDCS